MKYFPHHLDRAAQQALLADLRRIIAAAPLYTPTMPRSGKAMSVRMTNCGPLGWVTDQERGYRYQATHPETGKPWPPMPLALLDLWRTVADYPFPPEACLVNYYAGAAKMGLHQDKDEQDFAAPVLSVSLGDTGIFRVGGTVAQGPDQDIRAQIRRRGRAGRRGPARLSRHRPHPARNVRPAGRRRPPQSHAAAGDQADVSTLSRARDRRRGNRRWRPGAG